MFKRSLWLLAALILPAFLFASLINQTRATSTAVLIDAVLYDGLESNDLDEAVRLINVGNTAVDISGWAINDAVDSSKLVLPTATINPQQTIWLAKDGAAFQRQFGFWPDFEVNDTSASVPNFAGGSWPGYANTGDEVILLDDTDDVIDALVYKSGDTTITGWSGAAVPRTPDFGEEGQILYRKRSQQTGLPVPDTDTAVDWAQERGDVVNGRKVLYPGWDLDEFFQTTKITQTATLTVAIAPDNAYDTLIAALNTAQTSIQIEVQTFENLGVMDALIAARQRGVNVTLLMEAAPSGGVDDQEKYICQQLETAGAACWFMINDPGQDIYDRYRYIHAKFILIDNKQVIISSENLSPNSLPYDDKSDGTTGRRGVLLITDAPGVINHVQTVFNRDFDLANHQDITNTAHAIGAPPAGFVPITETGGISYTVRYPNPSVFTGQFAFEIVQSPENSLRDSDSLLGLVNRAGAGDSVWVEQQYERTYWGDNPTDDPNPRLEAYIAAARRGADVRLLLDSFFDDPDKTDSNAATCAYVNQIAQDENLTLACTTANPAGLGIHNKMVLAQIGGKGYVHVGSINGSEQSSKGNRELALQVQSDDAYALLSGMFVTDWVYKNYLPLILNDYVPPARYILISEVLYDPFGLDDAEFIELTNPTGQPVDLSNYALGDAVNRADFEDTRRFPAGTSLAPGGALVVATAATAFKAEYGVNPDFEILSTDDTVPDMIDDPAWGDPNAMLQLANGGDEVILRNPADQIVDAIAYGSGQIAGQTSCALVTASNHSLERYPSWRDTDDCAADFRDWPFPNPGTLP
ncbi:MAG TPA: hypothetical protein ENK32_10875 [Anaerolineae bacterium]|nr:hypothetical protein [Anaerolineae bacterium]